MTVQVQTRLRPPSTTDVLTSINYVCTLLGQKSFAKLKNGQYRRSYISILMALLHLSMYFSCSYFNGMMTVYDFSSSIVVVLKNAMFFGNIMLMVYTTISCHLCYNREVQIMRSVDNIDEDLFEIQLTKELKEKNKFLRQMGVTVVVLNYLIYFFLGSICLYFAFEDVEEFLIWTTYETIAPIVIIGAMKVKFYTCVLLLKTRSEVINQYLTRIISNCSSQPKHLEKLEKDIDATLKIHKKIVDTARTVNRVFGFMILATLLLTFIVLLSDGYIVLYCLTVGRENNLFHILSSARLFAYYAFEMLASLRITTLLCTEVNETKNILFKVKIEPDNVDTRNVIMVSVFKLMHDKLEVKACELFDMDLSFVFSMFASLTTYLLILLQFDIDSIQRNALNMFKNITITLPPGGI